MLQLTVELLHTKVTMLHTKVTMLQLLLNTSVKFGEII